MNFVGGISSITGSAFTGSGNSIQGSGSEWSGAISYSNGAFSGNLLWNGSPAITGSGNSIIGTNTLLYTVSSDNWTGTAVYSGTISYSNGSFIGGINVSVAGALPYRFLSGGNGSTIVGTGDVRGTITATPSSSSSSQTGNTYTPFSNVTSTLSNGNTYTPVSSGNSTNLSSLSSWVWYVVGGLIILTILLYLYKEHK